MILILKIFFLFNYYLYADNQEIIYQFPKNFIWGVATAPAHAEDLLEDAWIDWAKKGKVSAFLNQEQPEKRLLFWTHPEIEINAAKKLGVNLLRIGIDWGRFFQYQSSLKKLEPGWLSNNPTMLHYKNIISLIKKNHLKVMLTLFHHSLPKETIEKGGWSNAATKKMFFEWTKEILNELGDQIDYLITFNEPGVFNIFTYVLGVWPNGDYAQGLFGFLDLGIYKGNYVASEDNMIDAHKLIYSYAKKSWPNIQVSIAQQIAFFVNGDGKKDFKSYLLNRYFNYKILDKIKNEVDFIGINYYGAEHVEWFSVKVKPQVEYSEAGRAIHPNGFYESIVDLNKRYSKPIFITENGIADATDLIRPAYIYEHLSVLARSLKEKINIMGYVFWTLSDNWEWTDGYCPKFGLMSVSRTNLNKRIPRKSFDLLKDILTNNFFTHRQRTDAWSNYIRQKKKLRPFCRASDGVSGLDEPSQIPFVCNEWKFNL